MKRINKFMTVFIFMLIAISTTSVSAVGYIYSHKNEPINATQGYEFSQTLGFDRLGLLDSEFKRPEDLYIYNQEVIYIVDSQSNKLFIFDTGFNLLEKVDSFPINKNNYQYDNVDLIRTFVGDDNKKESMPITYDEEGKAEIKLYGVSGVYRHENRIYLADKFNFQIVVVDSDDFSVVQVITTPEDQTFKWPDGTPAKGDVTGTEVTFKPTKIVTDSIGRVYAIADEVYRGILEFSIDGSFSRFTGVNYVTLSPWELFWHTIATDAQRRRKETIINTNFTSLSMDNRGFIYATSRATTKDNIVTNDNAMIKKINPRSDDVLRRNGYIAPKGDVVYSRTAENVSLRGPSRFSAVTSTPYGTYTIADSKLGRLFTYDDEGYLLYISGDSGNQLDKLDNPVSVKYLGEDLIVLDRGTQSVAVKIFKPTPIAKLINKATEHYFHGEFEESSATWEEVVKLNSTYEYAYVGIGKALLKEGEYKEAMDKFQIGYSHDYYSKAYKLHRDIVIRRYFTPVATIIIAYILIKKALSMHKRRKNKLAFEEGEDDE